MMMEFFNIMLGSIIGVALGRTISNWVDKKLYEKERKNGNQDFL